MRISARVLLCVAALSLAACSSDRGTRAIEGGGIGAAVGAVHERKDLNVVSRTGRSELIENQRFTIRGP